MCGLFGFYQHNSCGSSGNKDKLMSILGNNSMVRGNHATGIAYNRSNQLVIKKSAIPASQFTFCVPTDTACIGHTRYTTKGTEKNNYNNHPFSGNAGGTDFALCHNGVIYNDEELRASESLPKTGIITDSYICCQLLEQEKDLSINSIKSMVEKLEGSFTLTILDNNNRLYIVVQDSPFYMIHYIEKCLYVYASTKAILEKSIIECGLTDPYEVIDILPGEIVMLDDDNIEYGEFNITDDLYDFCGIPVYNYDDADSYYQAICNYAMQIGITQKDIDLLLEFGYSYDGIEHLLRDYTIYDVLDYLKGEL